ncbi:aminotransferase class V-fold PLP-dependent enzyme [Reinekea sp.]|jgi:cysteine desulfurase/selenocysteine lyase|uniref:aminotransferase class V-fold PLP-dependent enzyme n=1 Tax=Reinekea sp. TaxID=1970455 RepID=UPI0039894655
MNSTYDIKRARQETLACKDLIHFNNAGASLMPTPVSRALHEYLNKEERIGGYETEALYKESLNGIYKSAAKLLNCSPDEIAFVENATRAWDMAFYSFKFNPGDKILTTFAEYGSNVVAYLQQAKRFGVEIVFVPNDEFGQIDVNALSNLIDDKVKLISITHIPTGGGLVNPAKAVGKVANAAGIPYILDSCQSVGQMPIDVEDIGCDILCITGRKFLRGPRGTGLLYVRSSLLPHLEPPMLDQHAAELISPSEFLIRPDSKRFENWEQYCAGKFALGVAIDYAMSWGLHEIQQRVYSLADHFRAKLSTIDGIHSTDEGIEKCGIITFTAEQLNPAAIKQALSALKINISTSKGSGSLVSFQDRGIKEVVRASVHYFNTDEEIDYFVDTLKKVLAR